MRVAASDIERIERELATVLPRSYIDFLLAHGPIYTPSLLELIVDGGHDLWDLMELCKVDDVIKDTKGYWSAGMSEELIGFASDSMGNMFCFRRVAPGESRPDDAEVWFFDHDFCKDSKIEDGFDNWLLNYLKLKTENLDG